MKRLVPLALFGALALSACTPMQGGLPYPPVPPPLSEQIPLPPVSETQLIWQPGHYDYTGSGGYVWLPGAYVPQDGHTLWMPGYWAEQPDGSFAWIAAHWVR